jgi:predicted ATPase
VYGHLRGDLVLRQFANRVVNAAGPEGVLFRYGGDEFVLLLPDACREESVRLALRLTAAVRDEEFAGEPPLSMSVSLGIATYPEDGADPATLLGCADRRNYLAKRRGRDCAVADDVDLSLEPASSRLWERDAALAAAQVFLTRLPAERRGALRVHGPRGAGHTRFLAEVTKIAKLRGLAVLPVLPEPAPLPAAPARAGIGVLLVADRDTTDRIAEAAAKVDADLPSPAVLGLAYAATGPVSAADPAEDVPLPTLAGIELAPWTHAAVRICVRTKLGGEPSRTLVNWLTGQTGGIPGRVVRELDRLRERKGLVATDGAGWTVAPDVLGQPRRRVRLPAPLSGLLGRERETERVAAMLRAGRLVTLVGPGGIGKTRLSLAVAAAVAEDYAEGVVFVPLAETANQDQVLAAVTRALEVAEVPGQPPLDTLADHLAEASLLLILDNFEQVLDAGPAISGLLAAAGGTAALVTSREPLALYGEQVYRVPPLAVPDWTLPPSLAGVARALAESPAVALFDQRARAADADFVLGPDALPAVVALCRRLDGLPLAIELAAARAGRWSPAALLDLLNDHLDALGAGPRDRPERQQTLRGAVGWSYDLLDAEEQRLFRTLAVFVGGATVEAIAAVLGADPAALPARLASLAGKSLLLPEPPAAGPRDAGPPAAAPPAAAPPAAAPPAAGAPAPAPPAAGARDSGPAGGEPPVAVPDRYGMLETIRAYAADRLAADPDAKRVRAAHAAYFVDFADQSGAAMAGPGQAEWADRLERDYQNLRAAMTWTLAAGDAAGAARACLGLWRYWRSGNHLAEGRKWLTRVLAMPAGLPDPVRARVLHPAAVLAAAQDDHEAASTLAAESLTLAEAAGDLETTAQARNAAGIAAIGAGDYRTAAEHMRHSLAIFRRLGDRHGTAVALGNLAKLALRLDDVAGAATYIDECLAIERATENTFGIVLGLETLARILLVRKDFEAAREALRESRALSTALGDVYGEAMALHQLGVTAQDEGDRAQALTLLTEALTRRHELGDREDLAISLDCVANLVASADPALAARLLGAADRLRERYRLPMPSEGETRREATLSAVRAALDRRAFGAAWSTGRGTPLDLIIDQVIDHAGPH